MARKKKIKTNQNNKTKVIGTIIVSVALLLLVALVTHSSYDDVRITGEIDNQISPFEMDFKNQGGMVGAYLAYFVLTIIGWLGFFIPFWLIIVSLKMFKSELASTLKFNSFIVFILAVLITMVTNIHLVVARQIGVEIKFAGGLVTENLTKLIVKLTGETGSYIILGGFILIIFLLFTPISNLLTKKLSLPGGSLIKGLFGLLWKVIISFFKFRWLKYIFTKKESKEIRFEQDYNKSEPIYVEEEPIQESIFEDESETDIIEVADEPEDRPIKSSTPAEQLQMETLVYSYPKIDLLEKNISEEETVDKEELLFTARMLKETLETFSVKIEGDIAYYPGPIITRYEFKPGVGIKINQIVNLSDDLALALKAKRIRIIAPIPGKAAVGVEIPNRVSQTVYLRDIIESEQFKDSRHILPIALGKTTSGKPFVADLTKMPHLLIAGATGSGKSVGVNTIITSLIYRLHPHQIRFIFIDPKMLELTVYSGIPHLGRPVVTKPKRAEKVLSDAVTEMENRYRKLANASVRNIADYNKKQTDEEKKLPYIVICVDELADLMMSATSSKIEHLITRLAQMSRAVGIHLVLATQRPSVDVITGLIKANFPARIAYQVSSKVDSRTIIDCNGAEKLLGLGDMLFLETGHPEPQRIHGAFISSNETEQIVEFIRNQGIEMMALEGITQSSGEPTEAEVDLGDPLFKEACEVVIRHKQGSVSLLQRRLGIGYQRAARLIDKLEQAGIVSGFDGSKARDVLVDKTYLESLFSSSKSSSNVDSEKN